MRGVRSCGPVVILGAACLLAGPARSQPAKKGPPKLEPVADTKLLMAGIADPNIRGLGKILKDKPKEAEAWGFAHGQAVLIAETGNLLMIRPPKTRDAQEKWMSLATELREAGAALGKATTAKDYVQSRAALAGVANVCNRCHQAFRVQTRIDPFAEEGK